MASLCLDTLNPAIEEIIGRLPGWAQGPAEILAEAAQEYGRDRASRMAAAIAYRTVFAFAPLLLILVAVLGAFLGSRVEAQQEILDAIEAVAGPELADLVESVIVSALSTTGTAAVLGGVLLLWTASSLFLEMQRDLNDIFGAPREKVTGLLGMVRIRGIGFLWTFGLGVILIVTWGLNALWRFIGGLLPESLERSHGLISALTPLVSVLILPVVFALIFRTMTVVEVPRRAVWVGALFTSVVFLGASYGVGLWFQLSEPTTALGFAGSVVVVLFLAYFLSMVFLYGAEVTKAYWRSWRTGARPSSPAVEPVDPQVLVSEPEEGLPRAAFLAFIAGLVVGWRRSRR